jgi:hypothetical protein
MLLRCTTLRPGAAVVWRAFADAAEPAEAAPASAANKRRRSKDIAALLKIGNSRTK